MLQMGEAYSTHATNEHALQRSLLGQYQGLIGGEGGNICSPKTTASVSKESSK